MVSRLWWFADLLSESGRNPIQDWYEALPPEARAEFDTTLQYLANMKEWRRPEFDWLHGKRFSGIGEIRFKAGRIQYRPLGCVGTERSQFVSLLGCFKKGKNYTPRDSLNTAARRRDLFRANPLNIEERDPYGS